MTSADGENLQELLDEQVVCYRAIAAEYERHALPFPGVSELSAALDAFRPAGGVLELVCGPGSWTAQLLHPGLTLGSRSGDPYGLSGGFEMVGEAAESDREPATEARQNTPARPRRNHARPCGLGSPLSEVRAEELLIQVMHGRLLRALRGTRGRK
ncbi:hypothetical protein [Nonomuraea glycinis]|uniref:hypothetical protein n=1 Tax=Nonomuraea glycinis TaxID=2047744 RepID=UPI0033A3A49A